MYAAAIFLMCLARLVDGRQSQPSEASAFKSLLVSSMDAAAFHPVQAASKPSARRAGPVTMNNGKIRELRERLESTKSTQRLTKAMQLVAAAKVRRAQEEVLRTRPYSQAVAMAMKTLCEKIKNKGFEDNYELFEFPLLKLRPVKKVALLSLSGDRGLCGGFNNYALGKAEARLEELKAKDIPFDLYTIGKKGGQYFENRYPDQLKSTQLMGSAPKAEDATELVDKLLAAYFSGDIDRIELVYMNFKNLVISTPEIRTLLPLLPDGMESEGDELIGKIATGEGGKLEMAVDKMPPQPSTGPKPLWRFEEGPTELLNFVLPIFLNGEILRCLQNSVASELGARMTAMQSATENCAELAKTILITMNRARQAKVTAELAEIISGAEAMSGGEDDDDEEGGDDDDDEGDEEEELSEEEKAAEEKEVEKKGLNKQQMAELKKALQASR